MLNADQRVRNGTLGGAQDDPIYTKAAYRKLGSLQEVMERGGIRVVRTGGFELVERRERQLDGEAQVQLMAAT